jgi:hypothetical protein
MGMNNYMPEKKESKDEMSVQKHIEWLQKEYKIKEGKGLQAMRYSTIRKNS